MSARDVSTWKSRITSVCNEFWEKGNKMLTGRSSQASSTPGSASQLSAPIVGRIREAKWMTTSRTSSAANTGFGRVFVMKVTSVCKWGRMFPRRGALWEQSDCSANRRKKQWHTRKRQGQRMVSGRHRITRCYKRGKEQDTKIR